MVSRSNTNEKAVMLEGTDPGPLAVRAQQPSSAETRADEAHGRSRLAGRAPKPSAPSALDEPGEEAHQVQVGGAQGADAHEGFLVGAAQIGQPGASALYPMLLEAAKCWCEQTFVASGIRGTGEQSAPRRATGSTDAACDGFSRLAVDRDGDLPWLTKKGAARKQPPSATYRLYFGLLRTEKLLRAIGDAIEHRRDSSVDTGIAAAALEALGALREAIAGIPGPIWLGRVDLDRCGKPRSATYEFSGAVWAATRAMNEESVARVPQPADFSDRILSARADAGAKAGADAGAQLAPPRLCLADIQTWVSRASHDCGVSALEGMLEGVSALDVEGEFALLRAPKPELEPAADKTRTSDCNELFAPEVRRRVQTLLSVYERADPNGPLAAYLTLRNGSGSRHTAGARLDGEARSDEARSDLGPSAHSLGALSANALSAKRIPLGKWPRPETYTDAQTAGSQNPHGHQTYAPVIHTSANGSDPGTASQSRREHTQLEPPEVGTLKLGTPKLGTPKLEALAAARAALASLSFEPEASQPEEAGAPKRIGPALHRPGSYRHGTSDGDFGEGGSCGQDAADSGRGGGSESAPDVCGAADAAREVAAGRLIERAKAMAGIRDPRTAFGLRPPARVTGATGYGANKDSLPAWGLSSLLRRAEVMLVHSGRLPTQVDLVLPASADGVQDRGAHGGDGPAKDPYHPGGRYPGGPYPDESAEGSYGATVLTGMLELDEPQALIERVETIAARLERFAASVEQSSIEQRRRPDADVTDAAGPEIGATRLSAGEEDPLLAAYTEARERFREQLTQTEAAVEEAIRLERDLQARPVRERRLEQITQELSELRVQLAEAEAQLEEDSADLKRANSALYRAKIELDEVEGSRPGLAHRMLAPAAERRWQADRQAASEKLHSKADRARRSNKLYEGSMAGYQELNEAVMDATRRQRHCSHQIRDGESRIRSELDLRPVLRQATSDPVSGACGGLWPLEEIETARERLFAQALELHELFAAVTRRYIVDNLRLLCRAVSGEIELEPGLEAARNHHQPGDVCRTHAPANALVTDLLATASLVAPVLAISRDVSAADGAAPVLAAADANSIGTFISWVPAANEAASEAVGQRDAKSREGSPSEDDSSEGGASDTSMMAASTGGAAGAPVDLVTLCGLHAAAVGLVAGPQCFISEASQPANSEGSPDARPARNSSEVLSEQTGGAHRQEGP